MGDTVPDVYLNIDGIVGECSDTNHPGVNGWIGICSLSFGFAFESGAASKTASTPAKAAAPAKGGAAAKGADAKKDDSNTPNKHVTFTKKPDASSTKLAQLCYDSTPVKTVTFEACRYGGSELSAATGQSQGAKIPFIDLTFTNVIFKKMGLQISNQGFPTESLEFAYDVVTMTTIWTNNATGDRVPGGKCQAGWDFVNNVTASAPA